ncbi:MAG: transglycosylase SLT domain-containing protein [Gemmatimonadetes bacterium]|nr:transglycosylase SLT domain-containing protein [Gemmatimonadota bacterium]
MDPRRAAMADPIVTSPWVGEDRLEERIDWWLNYWQNREREGFQRALTRMGRYEVFIDSVLAAGDMPASLRYLPIIEAAYYPKANSRAGAGGLWQFMPATARWLGLEVNSLVDQRLDPYAATPFAIEYLADLKGQFNSWFLALAAYNGGPGRVERAIRDHGDGEPREDALFLRIRDHLPRETRDFIPKYLAAVRIASDPAAFGMTGYLKDPPQVFDAVVVEGAASIDVIASAAGGAEADVRMLNPHLVLGLTPMGRSTTVRLPAGSGATFAERIAAVPSAERVTFTEHRVASGETLAGIARNYRVMVEALQAANPEVQPRRMQIGSVLVIPRARRSRDGQDAGESRAAGEPPPVATPEARFVAANSAPARETVHVVRRGDSLWLISQLHDVDLARLRLHNNLAEGAVIHPGDEIRIPPPG